MTTLLVLAGGRSTRLDGTDKAGIIVGGRPALEVALGAAEPGWPAVVVGPPRPVPTGVITCREDPPYAGPVAAIAAALTHINTTIVAVLAVDMPWAAPVLRAMAERCAATSSDAVLPRDLTGHVQPLCAAYRVEPLQAAIKALGHVAGASMRDLLGHLSVDEVAVAPDDAPLLADLDSPADLERARRDQP